MALEQNDQILVEGNSSARTIILNRPQKLNALSFGMLSKLLKYFKAFENDPNVNLVIVKGIGKAFSAGGDLAGAVHIITEGHWTFGCIFYQKQFSLNYVMATYRKPQVSLINGIVMGGGAGVSMHGKFRVVTENTVFSMPETSFGLFPDVGATCFLSRLPGFFGEYVGLTGIRLDGAEMLACGLATHFVHSTNLPLLEEALNLVDSVDQATISTIIDKFTMKEVVKENSAIRRLDIINKCFSKETVEEILLALEHEAVNKTGTWITTAIKLLKKASPISLKLFLRSIREGRKQDIRQCLMREYLMLCHVGRRTVSNDFFEGYRAILLDKDKSPKWEPSKLELVSKDMVDKYFEKIDDDDWKDLQLPKRWIITYQVQAKL